MRLGDIIEFRKDLYFEGAVQSDWFYDPCKAAKVAENFVFHGKNYFGVESKRNSIDTISLVKTLAKKLGKEAENPRSLAIADYGTGKSHLTVTLAQLFSGPGYMPDTYNKIIGNIRIIDQEEAESISELCSERNFVIVINGIRDFNLHSEILKATQKSLRLYGVGDDELKKLNRTIDTANRFFERNADIRLPDFKKAASIRGWHESGEVLLKKIREAIGTDDTAFEIVNDVYEETTGQRIRWEEGISAKAILEMLLSKYCGLNGQFDNVIILFDEFGRFLEYASGTDGGKCGDNALQEMFEVSQNAAGALHIINFIQTDIKTYLLRVDQSRNLSRYIGRYDESEKFHISSNLETVFANLIARKDKILFNDSIVKWQNNKEAGWKDIFEKIGKWGRAYGIWGDYAKFRKVVVEGIYPMHPVSVLMLTQLSDYLQNRSSMMLINQYTLKVSDVELEAQIPLVMPTDVMQGDLFNEMLAAETSGRHRSDYCIRFENVLKKNEQKLNETQITVLRANLITRTLRFNTRTYDEAIASLRLCSGLGEKEVEDALQVLIEEYAVLAFDEMSGCFDFTEDAKGAYDYKIMKRRMMSKQNADLRTLLGTASVLDMGSFTQSQQTNFGTLHKIISNEWCFTQEVVIAEDMTQEIACKYVTAWENSRNVVSPKGRLIWVYVNKDTDYHVIERLHEIAGIFQGTPVIMMLLNDADNMLKNVLQEYNTLERMDDSIRKEYSNIYTKDRERVNQNLKNVFDALKKNREQLTLEETVRWTKRLPVVLTEIFEKLYSDALSYNFDGLLTSGNNFTGNGVKYYCQILKMFLSNKVNFDTIHDFPRDVRNRIEALFMVDNVSSWKCLTKDFAVIPPLNERARKIFDEVSQELKDCEKYSCSKFFDSYCKPPYGMSEEAAAMFISMILVNHWHNIRIEHNSIKATMVEWKDSVVNDKKLHIPVFKESVILWVDTGSVEAKYQQLFQKIENNRDLDEANKLKHELNEMMAFYGLPESLNVYNKLAQKKFNEFENAKHIWDTKIEDVSDRIAEAQERNDVYAVLESIEMIQSISISAIFGVNEIDTPSGYPDLLKQLRNDADKVIRNSFTIWLNGSVYCKSVDQMKKFEHFYTNCRDRLRFLGYPELARKIDAKGEKELNNKAEIKSRQELISDAEKFIAKNVHVASTNYIEICELIKRADTLRERFAKYGEALGKQAGRLEQNVMEISEKWEKRKRKMDEDMMSVFDIISDAQTVEEIELAEACLNVVLGYTVPETDREEFINLQKLLVELTDDIKSIQQQVNRVKYKEISEKIKQKYTAEDYDYDFIQVIQDCINSARIAMDKRERAWRNENLTLGDRSRKAVHEWKQRIEDLPVYLSDNTLAEVRVLDKEANEIISEGKIEDVILYFDKLNNREKKQCMEVLKRHYDD